MPNPFAASEEGQEIFLLSTIGYPLAESQAELTPQQRVFLLRAAELFYQRKDETENDRDLLRERISSRRR